MAKKMSSPPSQQNPHPTLIRQWVRRILLLIFLLLPLWFNPFSSQIFELHKLALLRTLIALAGGLFLADLLRGKSTRWSFFLSAPHLSLAFYALVFLLATLFSLDPVTSLFGTYFRGQGLISALHLWILFLLLVPQLRDPDFRTQLYEAAALGTLPVIFYALLQRAGLDPFPWQEMAFGERVFSTLGQPNFLGSYLGMVLPFTVSLSLLAKGKKRWMWACLAGLALLTILLSQSRGALIGVLLGGVSFVSMWYWKTASARQQIRRVLLIGFCGGLLILSLSPNLQHTLQSQLRLDQATSTTRLYLWQGALTGISERPLLGHGPDMLYDSYGRFYDARIAQTDGTTIVPDRVHNVFLDTAYAIGLAGLLAWLGLLGGVLFLGIKQLRSLEARQSLWLIAPLSSLFVFLGRGQFGFSSSLILLFFWTSLAVIASFDSVDKAKKITLILPTWLQKNPKILTTTVLAVVLVSIYWFNYRPVLADHYHKIAQTHQTDANLAAATQHYEKAFRTYPEDGYYLLQWINSGIPLAEANPNPEIGLARLQTLQTSLDNWQQGRYLSTNQLLAQARMEAARSRLSGSREAVRTASKWYQQALSSAPERAALHEEWGSFLMQIGEFSEARDLFLQAIALYDHPDHFEYHLYRSRLGAAYFYLGEYEKTIAVMENIFHPGRYPFDSFEARFLLANAHERLGQNEEARLHLEQALTLRPDHQAARSLLQKL